MSISAIFVYYLKLTECGELYFLLNKSKMENIAYKISEMSKYEPEDTWIPNGDGYSYYKEYNLSNFEPKLIDVFAYYTKKYLDDESYVVFFKVSGADKTKGYLFTSNENAESIKTHLVYGGDREKIYSHWFEVFIHSW
jgi:hypothetical protein